MKINFDNLMMFGWGYGVDYKFGCEFVSFDEFMRF
jgi:hypothetical protein